MTVIILAGGKSSRMGYDKAFIEIGGVPLIKRQLKLLKRFFKKIIIVTNSPHKYRLGGTKIIPDIIPQRGPLGGIYSGLVASSSFYNFVVACDMPFINPTLIRYIMRNKNSYDIIIPKIDRKYHPIFGMYSKNCLPIIEKRIKQQRLKVSSIFSKVKTNFISEHEIRQFDPNLLSLMNINIPGDLIRVKNMEESICQKIF